MLMQEESIIKYGVPGTRPPNSTQELVSEQVLAEWSLNLFSLYYLLSSPSPGGSFPVINLLVLLS
jgi:hypothetical protein